MEVRINKATLTAVALVVAGLVMRVIPHTDNFAPVGAIALFAGAILGWRLALWIPLAIMVGSDLILGFHSTILYTWGGFVLVAAFGLLLKNKPYLLRVPVGALGSALIFYLVSNFGVWLDGRLYAMTWNGLVECYVMALPFLRTSFMADLSFSALIFGLYALVSPVLNGAWTLRLALPKASRQPKL